MEVSTRAEILRKRLRHFVFLICYPILVLAILANGLWLFPGLRDYGDAVFFSLMVVEFAVFVVFGHFMYTCRCPLCGERFFIRETALGLNYGNAFARKCLNCGSQIPRREGDSSHPSGRDAGD